jgi:hypothetical protein
MNVTTIETSLHKIADAYRLKLSVISDLQFQETPPIGGWSYSEVYFHIWDASMLSFELVKNCANGIGKDRPTKLIPRLILFFGSLPPAKYKAPDQLAERLKKVTKAEAVTLIDNFIQELEQARSKIHLASPIIKNKHPRLGYFNAAQWLRFIEIHLKHHYKQLQRIENSF